VILDIDLDKFFQVADWRIRPLPQGMIEYARNDSHFLIPLYLSLHSLLSNNNDLYISDELKNLHVSSNQNWFKNLKKLDDTTPYFDHLQLQSQQFSIQRMFTKNYHKRLDIKLI
jgi:ribonuclease D